MDAARAVADAGPGDGFVGWPEEVAQRYRAAGYWRGEVLGGLARDWARRDGGRTALVGAGQRWSYAELDRRADRAAAGLRALGIGPGDRVLVQLPNLPELVWLSLALFRLGALPVYTLAAHRHAEIGYLAGLTGARAYVLPDRSGGFDYRPMAAAVQAANPALAHVLVVGDPGDFQALSDVDDEPAGLPDPDPSGVAFFLLSGGTTGRPKLIPRTHDDYAFQLRVCADALAVDERSVYLAALPVAHNAALGCPGVLGTLRAGGTVVLSPTPSPDDAFGLLVAERVTVTTLMPPLLALWTELAPVLEVDLTPVLLQVGGANLAPQVARQVQALGCRLTHWFGMAEGVLCYTRLDDPPEVVAHTQGRPLAAADEYRVVDERGRDVPPGELGELLVRGPCTLRGYYRAPEYNRTAFTPDGFLRTGDLVRITGAGNLVVAGRSKDVINRGGEKIGAAELEEHVAAHPRVRGCAVVPVPDPTLGEKTCAFVVPRGEPVGLAELREFLTGRGLAGYKLPDRIAYLDTLPRTNLGKIDKQALRELAAAGRR
jgi:2,3-dihydroxybenzoate-AMP ligase